MMSKRDEFSVWVFWPGGWHSPLKRFTDVETAMLTAERAIGTAKIPGDAERVIITDGGDNTVFEWQRGKGVTWPPPGEVSGA
jgi:hypothetical protein